jgi:hypothetical protein
MMSLSFHPALNFLNGAGEIETMVPGRFAIGLAEHKDSGSKEFFILASSRSRIPSRICRP